MRILGIDPGNPTGVVILDTKQQQVVYFATLSGKGTMAMPMISQHIEKVFAEHQFDIVALEEPHGRFHNALRSLSEHGGAVRHCAMKYGDKTLYRVKPSEGQQALSGQGGAKADTMERAALVQFGVQVDEHVANAIGYALKATEKHQESLWKKPARRRKKVSA
jgi:Holliday junction resolvasome RuvABC endonuclease subunit